MTTIEITDVASVRTVNPLDNIDWYAIQITEAKHGKELVAKAILYKKDFARYEKLEVIIMAKERLDHSETTMRLRKMLYSVMEYLNYPEGIHLEVYIAGKLEGVHFSFSNVEEASELLRKLLIAEIFPEVKDTMDVTLPSGVTITVPAREVSESAVREELDKELAKFVGCERTPATTKLMESVVRSIINKHAFYGKR